MEIFNHLNKVRGDHQSMIHSALNSRVNQPLNLALNKAMQNAAPPDSAAVRLANLSREALRESLENNVRPAGDWNFQNDGAGQNGARDLDLLLVGEAPNMRTLLIQRLLDLLS